VPSANDDFIAVVAGRQHNLGLKSNGTIVAWGMADEGQCTVPEPNSGFVAIAAGGFHSLGLKDSGEVVIWGQDDFGQLVVPAPNARFTTIAAGTYHTVALQTPGTTAVTEDVPGPDSRALHAAPNPFNPTLALWFDLPRTTHGAVRVYDLSGRLIRTLRQETFADGRQTLHWDGRTDQGGSAPSGTYVVSLETADGIRGSVKVTLLK
jgi:hypothetical protein